MVPPHAETLLQSDSYCPGAHTDPPQQNSFIPHPHSPNQHLTGSAKTRIVPLSEMTG